MARTVEQLMIRINVSSPYFLKESPTKPVWWSPVMKKEHEEAVTEFNERMEQILKKPKTK